MNAETPIHRRDDFNGDDAHLISCIDALLDMDDDKCLVPHGLGGKGSHAYRLLVAARQRLSTRPAPAELVEALAEIAALRAELKRVTRPTLFWIDEDPETGYIDPWEVTEAALYHSGDEGVAAIREGRELGVRFYARLRADDEIGIDDDWLKDFDTEAEAERAIADERARRKELLTALRNAGGAL